GSLDLAASTAAGVSILAGNGDGTLQSAVSYAAGAAPSFVALGDFNGDGKPDAAVANPEAIAGNTADTSSSGISLLVGNGDGTFQTAGSSPAPVWAFLATGDFNGAGKLDLATTDPTGNNAIVLLGNGAGTPIDAQAFLVADREPVAVAAADINGDGKL